MLPVLGHEARTHRVIRHRYDSGCDAETPAELHCRLGEGLASPQQLRAQQMRGEILVADAKPRGLPGMGEAFEHPEGVAFDSVAGRVVEYACEPVDHRVDVGTDQQAPELIVVGGVGDDGQLVFRRNRLNSRGKRGTACASRQHDDLHRNRSSAGGRMRSRPDPLPLKRSPRASTAGVRSVFPITRPALDATSSATASTVACRGLPWSSGVPRRSIVAGRPATPSATFTMPSRQGRPKVSETMTPTSAPVSSRNRARKRSALASGSTGRRVKTSRPPTLEWSTPALAQTYPCRVSVIRTRSERRTRTLSSSTTWTMRGSGFATSRAAILAASSPAVTSFKAISRPSALDTTFCATTSTSPDSKLARAAIS